MKNSILSAMTGTLLLAPVLCSAGTFAQFTQIGTGTTPYSFSGGNGGTLTGTAVPVNFTFQPGGNFLAMPAALLGQAIPAKLMLTATANGSGTTGSVSNPSQAFSSATFTILANGGTFNNVTIAPNTLLLMGTSTPVGVPLNAGSLSGGAPGFGPAFDMTDQLNGLQSNTVTFSSAFLNFAGTSQKDATFSFSSATPIFSVTPGFPSNFINPFSADASATFSANPAAVPEPGSIAMLVGFGVSGGVFAFRRTRRRK